MTIRMKQVALTIGLTVPLAVSAFTSGPFSASTSAQAGMHMVGPAFPILIDVDGNGPSPNDIRANPQVSGTTLQVTRQFSCQTQNNTQAGLTGQDASGRYSTVSRINNFREQFISVVGSSGAAATRFSFTELDTRGIRASGAGSLIDMNGDGRADTIAISGNISATINLVFTPDSNYVSIPLSQAALLGGASSTCGLGTVPQIWVPLADTDGDGRGDTVIFDLNGDGIPDSQFYTSPRIAGLGVPAMSNVGLAILAAALGTIAVWFIGRQRPTNSTPYPAL